MRRLNTNPTRGLRAAVAALGITLAAVGAAQSSYRIGENGATADNGPVRMARFSVLTGSVNWRPTASTSGWSSARTNLPLEQGAQVYAPASSRAEVQFDDGADMRLGGGAVATLSTMYSDDKGEFTEVKLNNGLATFHLINKMSQYQIDTPTASIKAVGPAVIRVGCDSGLEVAVRSGQCSCEGASGNVSLSSGQYLDLRAASSPPVVGHVPPEDSWDQYNSARDQVCYRAHPNVPQNIGLVTNNIEDYGTWHNDSTYGQVWTPQEPAGWQPYTDGNWTWADPYGWTWVGNEPWGWAPYHYGAWIHESWGWGWRPGPAVQCWSPAVVNFSSYNGNVAWCPLAPSEIYYRGDALSVGIGLGNFFLGFSIGSTGCYYPSGNGYCAPYYWRNGWANNYGNPYNMARINGYYGHDGLLAASYGRSRFIPVNSRYGGAYASAGSFGRGSGGFHTFRGGAGRSYFANGRSYYDPRRGVSPVSGPFNVRPTTASFTPSRSFSAHGPASQVLNRPVYRAAVPGAIASRSAGVGHAITPASRVATVGHGSFGAGTNGRANRFSQTRTTPTPAGAATRNNRFTAPGKSSFANSGVARQRSATARPNSASGTRPHSSSRPNAPTANRQRPNTNRVSANAANRQRASNQRATVNRARAAASRPRPSVTRPRRTSRPASRPRSVSRPQRSASRPSRPASRPQRSFSRPSAPASRPQRSFRPPRQSPSRPSSPPRGGGGGGRRRGH